MKRIITLLLVVIVLFSTFSVFSSAVVFNSSSSITLSSKDEANLNKRLSELEAEYGAHIFIMYAPIHHNSELLQAQADKYKESDAFKANKKDVILILFNDNEFVCTTTGIIAGKIYALSEERIKTQLENFRNDESSLTDVYDTIIKGIESSFNAETLYYTDDKPTEQHGSNRQRLFDYAGLLSEEQSTQIQKRLSELSEKYQFDFVIVTKDEPVGDSQSYADDFFDYGGFGYNDTFDGVLLFVNMHDREWHISTTGYGMEAINEHGLDKLEIKVVSYLSKGKYEKAMNSFIDLSEKLVKEAKTNKPYSATHPLLLPLSLNQIGTNLLGGLFIAAICVYFLKRNNRKAKPVLRNSVLLADEDRIVTLCNDIFVTSKTYVRSSSSSGGGSSGRSGSSGGSHRSSSGRSHGGRGGRF